MKILTITLFSIVCIFSEEVRTQPIQTSLGKIYLEQAVVENGQGNSGRDWKVVLDDQAIGNIWGHELAMRLEDVGEKRVKLWAYIRGSSRSGRLGYYVIDEDGVSDFVSIEINPGDGGTELGNAIYRTIFHGNNILSTERNDN